MEQARLGSKHGCDSYWCLSSQSLATHVRAARISHAILSCSGKEY